ncbi:Elongation factor P [Candidatus Providencia siddallii]|uniref:Elongation factor P n=1 Tax=Candidatus Providencia siddallii TaxID=1715285 RepID=A0A0M6W6J8_9GAMM|nr:Elongation factor P [Candidatus Providencia siddallii]
MATYNTNEFRSGLKIILDKEPYVIIDSEFVKPGKGQAFARVRIRNIITNKILEKIFKSNDYVESADILDMNLTYLYTDNKFWYFINKKTFEQLAADKKSVGYNAKWLVEQIDCIITLWNSYPIIVTLPHFVELKVINTTPCLKGDTTSGACNKLATLYTGATVKVPLFIQNGEKIRIDTRSGEYVSRAK